jgi:hypothetical protein
VSTVRPQRVQADDLMQTGYVYLRTEPVGAPYHPDFGPELTPNERLPLGVFCVNASSAFRVLTGRRGPNRLLL